MTARWSGRQEPLWQAVGDRLTKHRPAQTGSFEDIKSADQGGVAVNLRRNRPFRRINSQIGKVFEQQRSAADGVPFLHVRRGPGVGEGLFQRQEGARLRPEKSGIIVAQAEVIMPEHCIDAGVRRAGRGAQLGVRAQAVPNTRSKIVSTRFR